MTIPVYVFMICHNGNICSNNPEAMCPECYCEIQEAEKGWDDYLE